MVAVAARYFDRSTYGLWALITAAATMGVVFDLGLGNGLRNKLARMQANRGDQVAIEAARKYFFAAFYTVITVSLLAGLSSLLLRFIPLARFVPTNDAALQHQLIGMISPVILIVLLNVAFGLSLYALLAYQEPQWVAVFDVARTVLSLGTMCLLTAIHATFDLILLSFLAVQAAASGGAFAVFLTRRSWVPVRIKIVDVYETVRDLLRTSLGFGVIQVASMAVMLSPPYLVAAVRGLGAAGDYSLAQRPFLLMNMAQLAMLVPLWSQYTESAVRRDWEWIRFMLRRSIQATGAVYLAGGAFMLLVGPELIAIWAGRTVVADRRLILAIAAWALVGGWVTCLSILLNGIHRLRRQAVLLTLGALAEIPLALWLGSAWGPIGVAIAGGLAILPLAVSNSMEVRSYLAESKMAGPRALEQG
jgi:O-antigen/teichoic acid export membrane protein